MDKMGAFEAIPSQNNHYKQYLILLLQSVMALQKPLHVAEFPFQQMGCVWDAQRREILKGKQPW